MYVNKAFMIVILPMVFVGFSAFGTFAQQIHAGRSVNSKQSSLTALQYQVKKLLSNPEEAFTALSKAVEIAQARLPKGHDKVSINEAFKPLVEQKEKLEAEYKTLPASEKLKPGNISEFASLMIAIKLLQKHLLNQLSITTLEEDIKNHKNVSVILKDVLGKAKSHR